MSEPAAKTRLWYVAVYLRNVDTPAMVPQASREDAARTVTYVAANWLKFPPEARPASCWIVARSGVVTRVDEAGVENATKVDPLAVFDPREVSGVQVVARDVDPWQESA